MISKKSLICLIGIVALLGAGIYFAVSYNPDEAAENSNRTEEVIVIYDKDVNTLNEINVKLLDEEFSFERSGDTFINKNHPDVKLKSAVVGEFASDISVLVAKSIISNDASDLAMYGLDNPKAKITAVFEDETKEILVGGQTKDSAYFACVAGDKRIFTLYSTRGDSFIKPFKDYRELNVLAVTGDELTKVSVSDNGEVITVEKVDGKWFVTDPIYKEADENLLNEEIFAVISYYAAENYIDDTAENHEKYGLKNSLRSVYLEDSFGKKQTFYFGNTENGYCYVKLDGSDSVFIMKESALNVFDTKAIELVNSYVFLPNIKEIKQIDIKSEGKTYTLQNQNGEYKINGVEVLEDKYKDMYRLAIGIRMSDFCSEPYSDDVFCTIDFIYNDSKVRTFEYVNISDRQAVVYENRQSMGYVIKKDITNLINSLKNE